MASVGWQIGAGGVPVAVSSLSHAYYGKPARPARSRRALATALPLRKVSQTPNSALIPLLVPECVTAPGSVILASADGANFRVSRDVLAYASPTFRRLFSAQKSEPFSPVSSTSSSSDLDYLRFPDETLKDGTLLIRLPESGKTLDALLRYLYPFSPSSNEPFKDFSSKRSSYICIEELKPVLEAAQKYVIISVLDEICARLLSDLALPPSDEEDTFALRVYALACRLNWKGLVEAAAYAALRIRVSGVYFPELEDLPAVYYYRLLDYHRRCSYAVIHLLANKGELEGEWSPRTDLVLCQKCGIASGDNDAAPWWENLVSRAAVVVRESPRSQRIFDPDFIARVFQEAGKCDCHCKQKVLTEWRVISVVLKEEMESRLLEVEFDLSALEPVDQSPTESEGGRTSRLYHKFSTIK